MTEFLVWLAKVVGALVTIGGGIALVSRTRPVRWLGRRLIIDPLGAWFRREVAEATQEFRDEVSTATDRIQREASTAAHLVRYHLGPNGTTPRMHKRLEALEEDNKRARTASRARWRRAGAQLNELRELVDELRSARTGGDDAPTE